MGFRAPKMAMTAMTLPGSKGDGESRLKEASEGSDAVWCLKQDEHHWMFLWGSEVFVVDKRDWGWGIALDNRTYMFDDLFAALDWWDESLRRKR